MSLRRLPATALAALCAFAACAKPAALPPNVLIVSIDTLRVDRVHAWGAERETSPTIDALVHDGVQFTQAMAQRGATWPSLTSIMTGKYPITHGVRQNGDMLAPSQRTLAEYLKEQGWRTAAFLTNMVDAPNRGFDVKVNSVDLAREEGEWDARNAAAASQWLRDLKGEQPFFAWVHFMDPHQPYHPPPPFDKAFDPDYSGPASGGDLELNAITLGKHDPTLRELDHILALYDGQILATDKNVAAVLKALEDSGRAENTLVVLVSDHGEELCDHQRYFFHACSMYDGVLRIVLALRWPKRLPAGKVVPAQVEEVDLLPTLFQLLDLPVPAGVEGESLVPLIEGASARKNPYNYIEYFKPPDNLISAIRDGRWKYIRNPTGYMPRNPPYAKDGKQGFVYAPAELYDVVDDPYEQKNVVAEHPDVAQRLEAQLSAWYAEKEKTRGTAGAMDAQTREHMKRLGYVGADER